MWDETDYRSQKWLLYADVLPYIVQRWPLRVERGARSMEGDIEELIPLWGIEVGEPYDGLFTSARLADGWKKDASLNPHWVRILDRRNRIRGSIFYGTVRKIVKASLMLCPRFGIGWQKTTPDEENDAAKFRVHITDGGQVMEKGPEIGPFGRRWWDGVAAEMSRVEKIVESDYPDRRNALLYWD